MISPLLAGLILAWVAILVLSFGFAALMRQVALLSRLVPGATSGAPHSDLIGLPLPRLAGLDALPAGGPLLLIVVSRRCSTCTLILNHLRDQMRERDLPSVSLLAVDRVPEEAVAGRQAYIVPQSTIDGLQVRATPYALVVDARRVVRAAGPFGSVEAFERLRQLAREVDLGPLGPQALPLAVGNQPG